MTTMPCHAFPIHWQLVSCQCNLLRYDGQKSRCTRADVAQREKVWSSRVVTLKHLSRKQSWALGVCWLDIKHGKGCVSDVHLLERVRVGQCPQLSLSVNLSLVYQRQTRFLFIPLRTYVLYLNYITIL